MNSLNRAQLLWNLTADPEIRQTPNWQFVANFNLATNRTWKDSSWMKQEQAEFHSVVLWWKLAEIAQQYFKKWKKIYVDWRLQTRGWEDQTWVKRYKTEIIWENVIMLWSPSGKDDNFVVPESINEVIEEDTSVENKKSSKKEEPINIEDIPF
jgi:single-strand DNA-binding protein